MDPQESDELIRHLVRIAAHQGTSNDDLRATLRNQDALLRQQVEIHQDVTTLAGIETLLARMRRQDDNSREA